VSIEKLYGFEPKTNE